MVGMTGSISIRAVELFRKYRNRKFVRESQASQREAKGLAGPGTDKAIAATNGKNGSPVLSDNPGRELNAVHQLSRSIQQYGGFDADVDRLAAFAKRGTKGWGDPLQVAFYDPFFFTTQGGAIKQNLHAAAPERLDVVHPAITIQNQNSS